MHAAQRWRWWLQLVSSDSQQCLSDLQRGDGVEDPPHVEAVIGEAAAVVAVHADDGAREVREGPALAAREVFRSVGDGAEGRIKNHAAAGRDAGERPADRRRVSY